MKKNDVQIDETYLVKVANNLVPVKITHTHDAGGWVGVSQKTGKTIRIKSAQRLRKRLADPEHAKAIHKADQENARVRDERAKAADGMTASERAMAESESDIGDEEVVVYRPGRGEAWRWRKGKRVCLKQYMAREQAERAAAKANPNATIRVEAASAKRGREATKDATTKPERDTGERGATEGQRDADDEKPMSLLDAAAHLLSPGTGDDPGAMRCKDIVDLAVARGLWTPGEGRTPANTLYAAISREIKVKGNASRFVKAERGKFARASKKGA